MEIKRTIEVTTKVTISELVDIFWSLDADKQASFFNKLYDEIESDEDEVCVTLPFECQMQSVLNSKNLTNRGRKMIDLFAGLKQ